MKIMKHNRNAAAQSPKPETVRKTQLQQDQQFEERLRIAERLVQALREAGYSCELGDDGPARALPAGNFHCNCS
jgi:hypothetical protein